MDKAKLQHEVQTLRKLVKITRANIIRKLLRDRKFWANKLTGTSVNHRAKKKLESVVAISDHIRSRGTHQLVKDILRFKQPGSSDQAESGSLSDRAATRFRADKKLASHLEALERQFGLQENCAILLNIAKKRRAAKNAKDSEIKKDKHAKKANLKGKGKANKEKTRKKQKSNSNKGRNEISVSESESDTTSEEESYGSDDDSEADVSEKVADSLPKLPVSTELKKTDRPAQQKSKQAAKKSLINFNPPEDDEDEVGLELVTDSFFVTETGGSYVAVAPKLKKKDDNEEESEEEEAEPWRLANKRKKKQEQLTGYQETNSRFHEKSEDSGLPKPYRQDGHHSETNEDLHPSWAAKQRQKGIKPFAGKKVVFSEDSVVPTLNMKQTEDLHPSWAAKQAQKGIKPFAGKKMVFGEEDDTAYQVEPKLNEDLHPSWAAKQAQKGIKQFVGKKIVFDADDESTGGSIAALRPAASAKSSTDLHPSWAAKQAQHGIKPFAGKRMVFDDEDDGAENSTQKPSSEKGFNTTTKPISSGIHPSWIAKQAQKGIRPFVGKKITFNDE